MASAAPSQDHTEPPKPERPASTPGTKPATTAPAARTISRQVFNDFASI